ncbi:MAG: Gfo/Idh/MocA family oxidoreductase [Lentisphaerae bacterium]|nr:Gfo/Idh/MocA family oxidoreductase [Lentisphaerota bacterium]
MREHPSSGPSRRRFLKGMAAGAAAIGFPAIVPSTVLGAGAPGGRIQLGLIGCGRIARTLNVPGFLGLHAEARIVAVSDADRLRMEAEKTAIEAAYDKTLGAAGSVKLKAFPDYREMIADKSIDAVVICTPDHWHAQPTIEAALAGKDIFLQKPMSLTIREGRQMADTVRRTGRILQVGSQLRSTPHFRLACDLVRCGRIGALKEVILGTPADPSGGNPAEMPVPENLNYDLWLGSTPQVAYTEDRVHPQKSITARPGWLRCEQFGAGMITGWGAHDIDVAQWGMGAELSGPLEVEATARFPKEGLWNVHGPFRVEARYAGGIVVKIDDKTPSSVRFVGEDGWILVSRGRYTATPSDPKSKAANTKALSASDPAILEYEFKAGDRRSHVSPKDDHHLDWLTSIRTRRPPSAPAEVGHRSCSACLVAHAAMKLGRRLRWDPATETFPGDDEANRLLSRPQRAPWGSDAVLKAAAG